MPYLKGGKFYTLTKKSKSQLTPMNNRKDWALYDMITQTTIMKPVRKEWKQFIPRPLDEVWGFFSRPENLNAITPDQVSFQILSPLAGQEMYEGMIIQYKISPFLGIQMDWVTEITHIEPGRFFIDDQRVGPYALWHHQHHFVEKEGGVEMTDLLHYQVPYGPIGSMANALFVARQIEGIFSFRKKAIDTLFARQRVEANPA
jgi:ligand-binding SRPBCC domain-containing protein